MKLKSIITLCSVLCLSSCSFFNPSYEKPQLDIPESWNQTTISNADIQKSDEYMAKLAWWKNFNDHLLNKYIDIALKDNSQIQMAIGNVLKAQADIDKARYSWLPTASIGGGGYVGQAFGLDVTNHTGNEALNNFMPQGHQTFGGSLVGIMPNYTINVLRQYKLGEITKASKKVEKNIANATRLAVISNLTAGYLSLVTAKSQLFLQEQYVKQIELLQGYAQKQYELGAMSSLVMHGISQQLKTQDAKVVEIKNDIHHFENALRVLMNKNPTEIKTETNLNKISTDISIPINLPAQVLKNRPDIAIAEYQLQIANHNIGLARSSFFPSIDLTGAFGNATLALANLASLSTGVWLAEAIAVVPVFNMGILADADKAKAQFYQAYENYILKVKEALQDVNDSLSSHDAAKNTLKKNKEALSDALAQFKIFDKKYQSGEISKAQLVASSLNLTTSIMQTNSAKMQTLVAIINLYQALGSGYNYNNNGIDDIKKDNVAWDK